MSDVPVKLDPNDPADLRAENQVLADDNTYLRLQLAVVRRELQRHAGPVRRNQSAENSRHGPQALAEQEQRSAAESRARMAQAILDAVPEVTSEVLYQANHLREQMRRQEQRHHHELEALRRKVNQLQIGADLDRSKISRIRHENETLRKIVAGLSHHGIDKIERALASLDREHAA